MHEWGFKMKVSDNLLQITIYNSGSDTYCVSIC